MNIVTMTSDTEMTGYVYCVLSMKDLDMMVHIIMLNVTFLWQYLWVEVFIF